jgi:hypothetical protein
MSSSTDRTGYHETTTNGRCGGGRRKILVEGSVSEILGEEMDVSHMEALRACVEKRIELLDAGFLGRPYLSRGV